MSSEFAIEVEGLSKCYQIYAHPRDRLLQMLVHSRRQFYREFWALRDVSLAVGRGETVGIIGRNGSGKSTLLQLICGTLNPSGGTIRTGGRIAALLELGSGFNPEFTGAENVFVNGSVLGLSADEIRQRYDSIVAFADIGAHLQQPVKTYSSGMMMRLAFSVAMHVDPAILVIDEALAVGDIRFQNKCFRKLNEFREAGCAILLVSHMPSLVEAFCDRVVWLNEGQVRVTGEPARVVRDYVNYMTHGVTTAVPVVIEEAMPTPEPMRQAGDSTWAWVSIGASHNVRKSGGARIKEVRVSLAGDEGALRIDPVATEVVIELRVAFDDEVARPLLGVGLFNQLNEPVIHFNTFNIEQAPLAGRCESEIVYRVEFRIPPLRPGEYLVALGVDDGIPGASSLLFHVYDAWTFQVASPRAELVQSGYVQTSGARVFVPQTEGAR